MASQRLTGPPWAFDVRLLAQGAAGAAAAWSVAETAARWPFDALRLEHAHAVQAGLVPNSMLASRDFEFALGALERLTLGPLARRN